MTQSWQNILSSLEQIIEHGDQGETFDYISECLSQSQQHVSDLKCLFLNETDADRKDIFLTALFGYASDKIDNLIQPPKNIRQAFHHFALPQYLYEFLWQERDLYLYALDTDQTHWQRLLDSLRYGCESYRFLLNGKEGPLPDDADQLFTEFASQSPHLTIVSGATLDCHVFEEGVITLKLDSQQCIGPIDLFDFMAGISVLLEKTIFLAYENMFEQPLFTINPAEIGFEYFPQNSLSPVSPTNITRPQLRVENLRVNGPLQTWGDLLRHLDGELSLIIGETVIFTKEIKAIELARQLERWHREGFKEKMPFAFDSDKKDLTDFIRFCPEGGMWRIESSLISKPESVPKITDLQLRWCVETFILEVFNATLETTGRRISLIFKEMYGLDDKLS